MVSIAASCRTGLVRPGRASQVLYIGLNSPHTPTLSPSWVCCASFYLYTSFVDFLCIKPYPSVSPVVLDLELFTDVQIVCEFMLHTQVIFINVTGPDNTDRVDL